MLSATQQRKKDMYDHFQKMVSSKNGITSAEFSLWCESQCWKDENSGELLKLNWQDIFKKIPVEFKNYLDSVPEGNMCRYYLKKGVELTFSFYIKHVGFEEILQKSLNKKVLKLVYHQVNKPESKIEVLIQPQYLRKYKGKTYIFGKYADIQGKLLDDKFFHIEIGMLDGIDFSKRKLFSTKPDFDWENHFKYIVGVDNYGNVKVEDITLKVRNIMLERFLGGELGKFIKEGTVAVRGKVYADVVLKMKRNTELKRLLLSYGSDLVVVSPEHLKRSIAKHINYLAAKYKN